MKKRIVVLLLASCVIFTGCASILKIEPQALDGQKEIYQDGVEVVLSTKISVVAIRPSTKTYTSDRRPTIIVSVLNGTEKPFNFSTENVQVHVDGMPHKIFTYDELVAEVEREQTWAAVAAAFSGAVDSMNAADAGYSYNSGTTNAYAYNSYSSGAYGSGTYSGYTYNAAAAQQAQAAASARTQANMETIYSRAEQSLNELSSTILKKTTIVPQMLHGGYVVIAKIPDSTGPREIKVVVTTDGESHEFLLQHSKVQD